MQMVEAKCIMPAWDSVACMSFTPGQGPLPEGLYKIDRSGPLAELKTPRGKYVFEFDRNAGPDDKPHDYSCKKDGCVKKFKTLADLGTHTKTDHKEESVREESDDVPVASDGRGKKKNKTFTCKDCGKSGIPNLYALGQHKKIHKAAVEKAA